MSTFNTRAALVAFFAITGSAFPLAQDARSVAIEAPAIPPVPAIPAFTMPEMPAIPAIPAVPAVPRDVADEDFLPFKGLKGKKKHHKGKLGKIFGERAEEVAENEDFFKGGDLFKKKKGGDLFGLLKGKKKHGKKIGKIFERDEEEVEEVEERDLKPLLDGLAKKKEYELKLLAELAAKKKLEKEELLKKLEGKVVKRDLGDLKHVEHKKLKLLKEFDHDKEHLIKDIDHDKEHLAKKIGKLITRAEEVAESEDFFKFPKKKHGKGKKIGKIFGERDVEDLGELHKLLDAKKKKEEEIGLALKALVGKIGADIEKKKKELKDALALIVAEKLKLIALIGELLKKKEKPIPYIPKPVIPVIPKPVIPVIPKPVIPIIPKKPEYGYGKYEE